MWSTRRKLAVGAAAWWPLVYLVVFLLLPATQLWFMQQGWRLPVTGPEAKHLLGMLLHALSLIVGGLALILLFGHLQQTRAVTESQRLPWAFLLILVSPLAMPVYWWLAVWREEAAAARNEAEEDENPQ